jgi:hypothetical protein
MKALILFLMLCATPALANCDYCVYTPTPVVVDEDAQVQAFRAKFKKALQEKYEAGEVSRWEYRRAMRAIERDAVVRRALQEGRGVDFELPEGFKWFMENIFPILKLIIFFAILI